MRENDLSQLSELQKAELEVLKVFDGICRKNGIKYYLTAGSMLGAVRHHGFIPWDDDIDVAMFRKDYEKFKDNASTLLPDYMYLSTYETPGHIWAPKVIDKRSTYQMDGLIKSKEIGPWVDILVVDGIPSSKIMRSVLKFFYLFTRMLYQYSSLSTAVNMHRKGRPWYELLAIKIGSFMHIENMLSTKATGRWYDWVCSRFDADKCENVAPLAGARRFKEVVPKKWWGEGTPMQFEDMMAPCPSGWHEYLTYLYGDYMTPPSISERERHTLENSK